MQLILLLEQLILPFLTKFQTIFFCKVNLVQEGYKVWYVIMTWSVK